MKLEIQRETIEPVTIGTLSIEGGRECDTLELPWKGNRKGASCIPAGLYKLTWGPSPRLKRDTLRLPFVPGRNGILIHPANEVGELQGCIALGQRGATFPDRLVKSRAAVQRVEEVVKAAIGRGEAVQIEIKDPE